MIANDPPERLGVVFEQGCLLGRNRRETAWLARYVYSTCSAEKLKRALFGSAMTFPLEISVALLFEQVSTLPGRRLV